MKTINLSTIFTLKSPLSHIGEAISTESYLSEQPVLQGDGTVEPVFAYSGNALRGQLRDFAAIHFCETLGIKPKLPAFHLLFSGGSIKGDQRIDIEHERNLRKTIPMISLFGGGIGTTMLRGKMAVGISWPICQETKLITGIEGELSRYGELTCEVSYTRFNDAKNDLMHDFIGDLFEVQDKPEKEEGVNQQMRFTSELIAAGARLVNRTVLYDVTEIEMGVFVEALKKLSEEPYLGGQRSRGHGEMSFEIFNDAGLFCRGGAGVKFEMGKDAEDCTVKYREFLKELKADEILALLGTIK